MNKQSVIGNQNMLSNTPISQDVGFKIIESLRYNALIDTDNKRVSNNFLCESNENHDSHNNLCFPEANPSNRTS